MGDAIKSMLTGVDNSISSKRVVMFSTLTVWFITIFANLFKGLKLDISLSVQLFSFLTTSIVLVFGEQIGNWLKDSKTVTKLSGTIPPSDAPPTT